MLCFPTSAIKGRNHTKTTIFLYSLGIYIPMMNGNRKMGGYKRKTGELSLTEAQVRQLLSVVGRLDHEVLLRIAIELGLRRADVVKIEQANINLRTKKLAYIETKKGGKIRRVPLSDSLAKLIEQYLNVIGKNRWLFPTPHKTKGHLHDRTAYDIFNKYLEKAGLPPRPFHALRATCIKLLQKRGWSIEEVMALTNDSFRTIKEHYDTPSEEEMGEVATQKPLFE